MIATAHIRSSETPRSTRYQRLLTLGLVLWTIGVVAALWWLLRVNQPGDGNPGWLIHAGGAAQTSFAERARDWFRLFHVNFQRVYPWVLFAPYVFWLASRFYLERGRLKISLPIQMLGCALFVAASHLINSHISMTRVVLMTAHQEIAGSLGATQAIKTVHVEFAGSGMGSLVQGDEIRFTHPPFTNLVISSRQAGQFATNFLPSLEAALTPQKMAAAGALGLRPLATLLDLLAYGSLAGLAHAIHFHRRFRERERSAQFLEARLARARLNALQTQLQPHFLFNTLNAIATLLRRDPRAAEATLLSLSELLRLALSQSDKQVLPLREELGFLDRYLQIQQTRFADRLRFEQNIAPDALDCLVPTLLLQPLVENAIRHGIEPSPLPGTVKVAARRQDDRLVLSVEDDGVGLNATNQPYMEGIGLANLRERLTALYGSAQSLELRPRPEGGVAVKIEIPLQTAFSPHFPCEP